MPAKVDTYWIKFYTILSVALHIVMTIASIAVRTQHNSMSVNAQNPNSFLYSYYKPDILGEFNSSKPSYTIGNLSLAYSRRCDGNKQDSDNKLLVLHAAFDADNARRSVQLTWIPVQFHFMGHYQIDGYVLLILICGFSVFFEAVSYYFVVQSDRDDYEYELTYTERPCMWRWMEYAVTSPLQILLVASSLMIRDIYTLYMLLFAQVALVQLGFAVEYAISAKVDNCKGTLKVSDVFGVEKAWHTYPLMWGPKPALAGPKTKEGKLQSVENPCLIDRLFWFSFSPAWLLHGAIWGILIQYFAHQDVDCETPAQDWTGILAAVVTTQCLGFTSFTVIPLFQALKVGILPSWMNFTWYLPGFLGWFKLHIPTDEDPENKKGGSVLHWAFGYYTLLSLVVKITLDVTYMSFVTFFPFATDHNVHRTF